jgi:ketosteroid isomerase-like protein
MDDIAVEIIALEKIALTHWGNGDPDGFLEICAPDVVYFDPYLEMRIDGKEALTEYYEALRGKVRFDRFELLNPHVHASGDLAVLTFNYVSNTGDQASRWNCTEAYRREPDGRWLIVQTHWSYTNGFKYRKG